MNGSLASVIRGEEAKSSYEGQTPETFLLKTKQELFRHEIRKSDIKGYINSRRTMMMINEKEDDPIKEEKSHGLPLLRAEELLKLNSGNGFVPKIIVASFKDSVGTQKEVGNILGNALSAGSTHSLLNIFS